MANEWGKVRTGSDGKPTMARAADWHANHYGRRIGGAELYKPGADGLDNPTQMARDYFILTMKEIEPAIISALEGKLPLFAKVMEQEQDAERARLGGKLEVVEHTRANSTGWIFDCFSLEYLDASEAPVEQNVSLPLDGETQELRDLVYELVIWANRYHLAEWVVRPCLSALLEAWRRPDSGVPFGHWIGHPGQRMVCPSGSQRVEYEFTKFDSSLTTDPPITGIDELGCLSREFVFRYEGYDPTIMTRSRFEQIIRSAFEKSVRHYAGQLENELESSGYLKCPEFHNTEKFEMTVRRFCLEWTSAKIAEKHACELPTVENAIRQVAKLIDYRPKNLPRAQRHLKRRGKRIRA